MGASRARKSSSSQSQFDSLAAVLDEVRAHQVRTRPEIIRRTGLSRAIVTQRVAELVERGLLIDAELGPSTGGRAPRLLRFSADAGHVFAASLGATSVAVAVSDLSGKILHEAEEPADIAAGPEPILSRVAELFEEVGGGEDVPGRLWGVGVGIPGPVEFHSGRAVSPPIMPGWDMFPVAGFLGDRFGVPVWVDNDVNVMALGEAEVGTAKGHDNFVFVKIGTGIGAGVVANGRLQRGAQGCAGDVGHVRVSDDASVICRCGKIGCLEALAGGAALARHATAAAREGRSPFLAAVLAEKGTIDARDVGIAATHGDRVANELIHEAGRLVGAMLATTVNLLNPSLIVIGGGLAGMGDNLLASIRQTIYGRSLPLATRDLAIRRSSLDEQSGLIGAATMVIDELFSRSILPMWLPAGHPAGLPRWQEPAAPPRRSVSRARG